jgi:hypothetical protein
MQKLHTPRDDRSAGYFSSSLTENHAMRVILARKWLILSDLDKK